MAAAVLGASGASEAEPGKSGVWGSCLEHFVPRAEPRVDVLRIGVACGPVAGLTRYARANGIVDETAPPVVLGWKAEPKDCFRLFAVAGGTVDDLEVEVVGPHGTRASLTNQSRRWAVVGVAGPFCAPEAGDFEARFSTHGGHGALSAAVWRGARMLGRRSPYADGESGADAEGSGSGDSY